MDGGIIHTISHTEMARTAKTATGNNQQAKFFGSVTKRLCHLESETAGKGKTRHRQEHRDNQAPAK